MHVTFTCGGGGAGHEPKSFDLFAVKCNMFKENTKVSVVDFVLFAHLDVHFPSIAWTRVNAVQVALVG